MQIVYTKPTPQMRKLCKSLGENYRMGIIDFGNVIIRDLNDKYDVEIGNVDCYSEKREADIYVWYGKRCLVETIYKVPRDQIAVVVDELYNKYKDIHHNVINRPLNPYFKHFNEQR